MIDFNGARHCGLRSSLGVSGDKQQFQSARQRWGKLTAAMLWPVWDRIGRTADNISAYCSLRLGLARRMNWRSHRMLIICTTSCPFSDFWHRVRAILLKSTFWPSWISVRKSCNTFSSKASEELIIKPLTSDCQADNWLQVGCRHKWSWK